ncbi:hypothetical protein [Kocuria kalidii]|uniref:hypothetical protein n=1 Tax=Kocuria kalidii TaxID=3376283 RepID=UPI0037B38EBC
MPVLLVATLFGVAAAASIRRKAVSVSLHLVIGPWVGAVAAVPVAPAAWLLATAVSWVEGCWYSGEPGVPSSFRTLLGLAFAPFSSDFAGIALMIPAAVTTLAVVLTTDRFQRGDTR